MMPDTNGYPTKSELRKLKLLSIHCFESRSKFNELLDFIESIWWASDWGFKRTQRTLQLHTGGWSGNEDIIYELKRHFGFWSMCWQKSIRGGHYYFTLPVRKFWIREDKP